MEAIARRLIFLFSSTRGLVLVAIALISLITVLFGTLSGPMAELGIKEHTVRILGMRLVEAEREGRIIMLYHVIAMAVVAIEVYLITALLPMSRSLRTSINTTITVGYIISLFSGLIFAYFGRDFAFHGLFLFGQSLVFFAGVQLAVALWPWKPAHRIADRAYASTRGGVSLERVAFFVMALATLGSALFGAIPGSYWGQGHETFLAEDLIREPVKSTLQRAIIGHLHIMLTLIAVALALLVGRWLDFKGLLHKIAMPLMIAGTVVITLGVWVIVPYQPIAHTIIYVGSMLILLAALMLVIFGFGKLIREGVQRHGGSKLAALLRDPLRFGALWQMVFMNFVVTGPGIFMAVKLRDIIRVWPFRDERVILVGHWHILAGIIATIILLLYADLSGLKGKTRQIFGWTVILGSDLAFGAMMVFSLKRLFVSQLEQWSLVNWTISLADMGLFSVLLALGGLMFWRLMDLFRRKGAWSYELDDDRKDDTEPMEGRIR